MTYDEQLKDREDAPCTLSRRSLFGLAGTLIATAAFPTGAARATPFDAPAKDPGGRAQVMPRLTPI